MAATEKTIEFDFRQDPADYYLIGDQIWYSSLFTHHTMSAIERDASGNARHVLDLSRLDGSSPEADELTWRDWDKAVFIGKLMTSGRKDEQKLLETRKEKGRPHKPPELIADLARKHSGFHTALFVLRPIYGYGDNRPAGEAELEENPAQLVACIRSNNARSLRVIPADVEEHYYDEQYGEREELAGLSETAWRAISAFHRMLYDLASDGIAARRLGEEVKTQLSL